MTDWHVNPELLLDYEQGALDPSRVMAVDAHLQHCPRCRSTVRVDMRWLDDSWAVIYDGVHTHQPKGAERLLRRAGLPEHRARLLTATSALRWSWLGATTAVLTFAVVAANTGAAGARLALLIFLMVAPVLPVLAVATAYGPPFDPMHEITSATPMAGPSLVLWRAAAVVAASMAVGAVAAALLPGPGWWAVAWLLPALLLSVGSLALATVTTLPLGATLLGGAWLAGVGAVAAAVPGGQAREVIFGPSAQTGYLIAVIAAGGLLAVRRRRLDPGESR